MKKGLLDYLSDSIDSVDIVSIDEKPTLDDTALNDGSDELDQEDYIFITAICSSYIESYETGDLTFEKSVRLTWTFLDDYEGISGYSDALYTFKAEVLYETLEHLVTLKPDKGKTKRTLIGTPPPKLRSRVPEVVDGLMQRDENLRKLPVDTIETDTVVDEFTHSNVFIVAAEKFQNWGFPNTTPKMIYDSYYANPCFKRTSSKSS